MFQMVFALVFMEQKQSSTDKNDLDIFLYFYHNCLVAFQQVNSDLYFDMSRFKVTHLLCQQVFIFLFGCFIKFLVFHFIEIIL